MFRAILLAATAAALLSGCTSAVPVSPPPTFLLLGEVHDNPDGHARRFADLESLVEQGWRPALAMEQFDLDRAGDLAAARATCPDADCVIRLAGGSRWDWPLYRPVLELAMRYELPIVAANLSRAQASGVVRQGLHSALPADTLAAFSVPQTITPALLGGQQAEVERGHCGKAPPDLLPGLAHAQIARDIGMAAAMLEHQQRGVVLLAGNGHVRSDIGVPYWLRLRSRAPVLAIAYLEKPGEQGPSAFDREVGIRPFSRPDPCAGLEMRR